jgi:hypothetical protein
MSSARRGRSRPSIAFSLIALVALTLVVALVVRDAHASGSNSITFLDFARSEAGSSLELDAQGNPVISYWGGGGALAVIHCGNPDCSSGNTRTFHETRGSLAATTSLVLDNSGNPVVSYNAGDGGGALKILHCGNPNCTANNTTSAPDPTLFSGFYSSIVLDAAGSPVVSYYDFTHDELKLLHCGDAACSAGNVIATPDGAGFNTGSFSSLQLDSHGNPVIAYMASFNAVAEVRVVHCGNPDCTSGNTIATAIPLGYGDAIAWPAMMLDAAGNPVISYYETSSGSLGVGVCGDPNCATVSITPNITPSLGFTSLTLDAVGYPVIAYAGLDHLGVVHCGSVDCSSGNVIATPDAGYYVGRSPSIQLDADGNPVVSYSGLTVLHCGDPYCSPDTDGDGTQDPYDNCPNNANPGQEDSDGDGLGDVCDNCPSTFNADQANADGDALGDVCDTCPDASGSPTNGGCPFPPSIGGVVELRTDSRAPAEASHGGWMIIAVAALAIFGTGAIAWYRRRT